MDKLVLQWKGDEPVEFNEELELPQFKLSGFNLKDCTKHYHTGKDKFNKCALPILRIFKDICFSEGNSNLEI